MNRRLAHGLLSLVVAVLIARLASSHPDERSWKLLPLEGAPSPRERHTICWTGREAIVFGGHDGRSLRADGARFDPATSAWRPMRSPDLRPRAGHTAVWTGRRMVVFGGEGERGTLGDGASYDPETDSWSPISAVRAPSVRAEHTALWTGREMIVWGGVTEDRADPVGAAYDPVTDAWRPLRDAGAPRGRRAHTAVWTGREMIVWGGINGSQFLDDGARYDPELDRWVPLAASPAAGRGYHAAVWDGTSMLVVGGSGRSGTGRQQVDGWSYDPGRDGWTAMATGGAPSSRRAPLVGWTGEEMLVWGGTAPEDEAALRADAGAYVPGSLSWKSMPSFPGRIGAKATWATTRWLLWGGIHPESGALGGSYTPPRHSAVRAREGYRVGPVERGGVVRGFCTVTEDVAPQAVFPWPGMGQDVPSDRVRVGPARRLGGCVVRLESVPAGKEWPEGMRSTSPRASIQAAEGRFSPHVQWVRPGTQVEFRNRLTFDVGVRVLRPPSDEALASFVLASGAEALDRPDTRWDTPNVYLVTDEGRRAFTAYLHVVDNPYCDVTRVDGAEGRRPGEYVLEDVPPGRWTVRGWHEGMEQTERWDVSRGGFLGYVHSADVVIRKTVTVDPGRTTYVDFEFAAPPRPAGTPRR